MQLALPYDDGSWRAAHLLQPVRGLLLGCQCCFRVLKAIRSITSTSIDWFIGCVARKRFGFDAGSANEVHGAVFAESSTAEATQ